MTLPTADNIRNAAERAPWRLLEVIRQLSKKPTDRNVCYATGYITAYYECKQISAEDRSEWMAVIDNVEVLAPTLRDILPPAA